MQDKKKNYNQHYFIINEFFSITTYVLFKLSNFCSKLEKILSKCYYNKQNFIKKHIP